MLEQVAAAAVAEELAVSAQEQFGSSEHLSTAQIGAQPQQVSLTKQCCVYGCFVRFTPTLSSGLVVVRRSAGLVVIHQLAVVLCSCRMPDRGPVYVQKPSSRA